jgi:F-type H+-transporting ATPase subunit b
MINTYFASEAAEGASEALPLGLSLSAFLIQLATFVFVFLLLKRFAFKPIIRLLEKRRQTIEDGVKLGEKLEKEKAKFDKQMADEMRTARADADKVIANAHKEAREIVREAEKSAGRKVESMMADAEVRIVEETQRARRGLEKDIVGLVSEATEAIVEEKVDAKKDAELIEKAIKGRNKK